MPPSSAERDHLAGGRSDAGQVEQACRRRGAARSRRRRARARGRGPWRRPAPGGPRPARGRAGTRPGRGRRPAHHGAHRRPTYPRPEIASLGSRHRHGSARTLADPMERFGFVGLPNAGKSSLYNALAGGGALAAPYAFATTDPNVGVARVPDPRLDALAAMSQSRNVVPATVQFVDIGGLVAGASKGEGLGNKFLSHIREADAIVFVLRAFADDDVPGPVRPARAPRHRRARAHLRRPRDGREPDREAPQGRQGRQVARRRGGRARAGQGHPRDRHADLPLRPQGRRPAACSSRTSSSPTGR